MYIHAVDTRPEGVSKAAVAKDSGVNKNVYTRFKKQLVDSGTLETKAIPGRPLKLSQEDYKKLEKLNTKVRSDLRHAELAPKLSRALG